MTIPILIVDTNEEFCILIRQTLEETGRYQVTLASTAVEAVEILESAEIELAIVDFGLPELPGPDLVRRLRAANPELAIIAIPLGNGADDPELAELDVDGYLSKPFYLPDLPEIVEQALNLPGKPATVAPRKPRSAPLDDEERTSEAASTEPPPPWLEDVDRAAQYLTRLNLESSAEASLLTRGRRVWAYAGQLAQSQVQKLTGIIADHWAREGARGAVAKFVHLPGAVDDFMLYATALKGDIILSMVFSAETPFGMIRRQAQSLARTLSEVDPSDHRSEEVLQEEMAVLEEPEEEGEALPLPQDWIPEEPSDDAPPPLLKELEDLDLPPPDPEVDEQGAALFETDLEEHLETPMEIPSIPEDWLPAEARPASHLPFLEQAEPPEAEVEGPWAAETAGIEEYLAYAAVLVPRFPEHQLDGPLAEQLSDWIKRICLAWDWRAEEIDLQPDYLGVTLSVLPDVAPAQAVRKLRENLSTRILETFPELSGDLPSGRFWARSYLLTAGAPPDTSRIQAFILDTRRAQGLS